MSKALPDTAAGPMLDLDSVSEVLAGAMNAEAEDVRAVFLYINDGLGSGYELEDTGLALDAACLGMLVILFAGYRVDDFAPEDFSEVAGAIFRLSPSCYTFMDKAGGTTMTGDAPRDAVDALREIAALLANSKPETGHALSISVQREPSLSCIEINYLSDEGCHWLRYGNPSPGTFTASGAPVVLSRTDGAALAALVELYTGTKVGPEAETVAGNISAAYRGTHGLTMKTGETVH